MDPRDTADTKGQNQIQIQKMEKAKAAIRSMTVGELLGPVRTKLIKMFNVGMEDWNDNTKLGEVMTKLNRKNADMYRRAVPLLVDVSKDHHPNLAEALEFLHGINILNMHRVYEVEKKKARKLALQNNEIDVGLK